VVLMSWCPIRFLKVTTSTPSAANHAPKVRPVRPMYSFTETAVGSGDDFGRRTDLWFGKSL
jgi:hypothetical protein